MDRTASKFSVLVDLASDRLGASVVAANDEFFAAKENVIRREPPEWREGVYTERGKWMDGWETRRRRDEGHDWCIVRLGVSGVVRGVDIETTHFKGNAPEKCAIDACEPSGIVAPVDLERERWRELLAAASVLPDSHNEFDITDSGRASYVRLRIFPDGGVARLRVYGDVAPDWPRLRLRGDVDLAAIEHGGFVIASSDRFFGSHQNLIMPGDPRNMGDGWETKRRRGPGHDWAIVKLGTAGTIRRVEIDTRHFKGNAPGSCSLEACVAEQASAESLTASTSWRELLSRTALQPDTRHLLEDEIRAIDDVTHVRFNIFPDGGVARLRLFGRPR